MALMPKCPVCVAAYVTLVSGFGLSITAATYLRNSLIAICVTSLAYVALGLIRSRFGGTKSASNLGDASQYSNP